MSVFADFGRFGRFLSHFGQIWDPKKNQKNRNLKKNFKTSEKVKKSFFLQKKKSCCGCMTILIMKNNFGKNPALWPVVRTHIPPRGAPVVEYDDENSEILKIEISQQKNRKSKIGSASF